MAVQQSPSLSSVATDPLRVFKFQVNFHPPQSLAASLGVSASAAFSYGFMTVSGPAINIEVIPYREGGMNALDVDTPVLTVTGWKRMGDIEVGDRLVDPRGDDSKVTGVYPRGMRPVYRVTLADGRFVLADAEHLWQIEAIGHNTEMTVTTAELRELAGGRAVSVRSAVRTRLRTAARGVRVVGTE